MCDLLTDREEVGSSNIDAGWWYIGNGYERATWQRREIIATIQVETMKNSRRDTEDLQMNQN